MQKPLNLRDLRYFVVVAEEENLHRAAQKLAIAQPALSRRIRDLEKTLQVTLFHRRNQRIQLSHVGKEFLKSAHNLLDQAALSIENARRIFRGEEGKLSIGITEFSMQDASVKKIIRWISDSYPNVNVIFEPMTSTPLTKRIANGELDFAFVTFLSNDDLYIPNIEISHHEFVAAIPHGHKYSDFESIRLVDFHNEEIIYFHARTTPETIDGLKDIFNKSSIDVTFKPMFMTEHSGLHLVSAGLGMSILTSSIHNYLPDTVHIKRIVDLDVGLNLIGLWNPETDNPVVGQLVAGIERLLGKRATLSARHRRGMRESA